jgi:hypothetical protein
VVYIHGYYNCIQNIVRPESAACNCSAGGDIRDAYGLIDQFELAMTEKYSSTNIVFIAAEVAYDQANDSPGDPLAALSQVEPLTVLCYVYCSLGKWSQQGMFRAYLSELLGTHMVPYIGSFSIEAVDRVRIYSHSGGYYTIGAMATVGGMGAAVKDLELLDSLYANFDEFDAFVQDNLCSFGVGVSNYRFSSVYSADGGTYSNNQAMATRAEGWVKSANCSNPVAMMYDNSNSNLTVKDVSSFSLIFKYTTLEHNDIPRNMFLDLLLGGE